MAAPWFTKYNDSFTKTPGQNDAAPYGVTVEYRADAIFQVIGIHHLDQSENRGNHHIFIDVLDSQGKRIQNAIIAWTWQGRKDKTPLLLTLDKPPNEPAGNIPLQYQQTITLWVWSPNEYGSDRVSGIHTRHPDEPPGNTWGHHSFYIVFQRTDPPPPPLPPTPGGGQGGADPPAYLDLTDLRRRLETIRTAATDAITILEAAR